MVTVPRKEQAEALRDELDTLIGAERYPADLTIASTAARTIVISSLGENRVRYIDRDGRMRG